LINFVLNLRINIIYFFCLILRAYYLLNYIVKGFGLIKRGMRSRVKRKCSHFKCNQGFSSKAACHKKKKLTCHQGIIKTCFPLSCTLTLWQKICKSEQMTLISECLFSTKESTNSGTKYFKPPSQKQMVFGCLKREAW
jgi:hypothetical protein